MNNSDAGKIEPDYLTSLDSFMENEDVIQEQEEAHCRFDFISYPDFFEMLDFPILPSFSI